MARLIVATCKILLYLIVATFCVTILHVFLEELRFYSNISFARYPALIREYVLTLVIAAIFSAGYVKGLLRHKLKINTHKLAVAIILIFMLNIDPLMHLFGNAGILRNIYYTLPLIFIHPYSRLILYSLCWYNLIFSFQREQPHYTDS